MSRPIIPHAPSDIDDYGKEELKQDMEEAKKIKKAFSSHYCRDCMTDPEVHCPRNPDVKCLECGVELCGYHMVKHLEAPPPKGHLISTTWKGM